MTPDPTELPEDPRLRVGVLSAPGAEIPQSLFDCVQDVFPIRFQQTETLSQGRFDGVLAIGDSAVVSETCTIPMLMIPAAGNTKPDSKAVDIADDRCLARPLRGARVLDDSPVCQSPREPTAAARVLAQTAANPVWWQSGSGDCPLWMSAYPLAQPRQGERLREYLRPGRFMGLLPLVQFLLALMEQQGFNAPPLRASFVIDDPNLHWPSYGFLKYRQLVDHASRHGYHVGFATVPLDGWLVNPRAASLIRDNPTALSLLMHGNDHVSRELGRLGTDAEAEASIAQALRRTATLERRSGIGVERVMAPPHGACSETALGAMFRLGIEAACISRPYPWLDGQPAPTPLEGWRPAEMVAGGLPVLPRYSLSNPREELMFRALLGQPLILYGHHWDFSDGLDLFAQTASYINGLGDVRWSTSSDIARRSYTTRRHGARLRVTMHSRRITLDVPEGLSTVYIEIPEPLGGSRAHRLLHRGGPTTVIFAGGLGRARLELSEDTTTLDLTLIADRPLDPDGVAAPAFRPWPLSRRLAVEARDRARPLLR
jgi:hypothetical protein